MPHDNSYKLLYLTSSHGPRPANRLCPRSLGEGCRLRHVGACQRFLHQRRPAGSRGRHHLAVTPRRQPLLHLPPAGIPEHDRPLHGGARHGLRGAALPGSDSRQPPAAGTTHRALQRHNGERCWRAATDIADLVATPPDGLERYSPSLRYLLLDEDAIIQDSLSQGSNPAKANLAEALFQLEYHRDEEDLIRVLGRLAEWLDVPSQTGLRRAFTVWIRRVLLPGRAPELDDLKELQDMHEVHDMLEERVKNWHKRWEEQGIQRGIEQGMKRGIQIGEDRGRAAMLTRQLHLKFGELPADVHQRLAQAGEAELDTWAERILFADSLDAVFTT